MQISRRAMLATTTAAIAMPALVPGARAEAKVIRISTPGGPDEWLSKSLVVFKDALEEAAPGQFDVQIHLNATLFAQGTEIPAMQRGNLEIGLISPQDVAEQIPEYSIFTAGYLIRDRDHLEKIFTSDIGDEVFAKITDDLGVQPLGTQYHGQRHVLLREPKEVKTPADLAGMKMRVPGSESWQFLGAALGGNPTPIAFDEVYLALKTGTVDSVEQPLADVISAKFYEVTDQIVLTGHLVSTIFFAMAKPFWDSLSDEEKAAVQAAADAAIAFNNDGISDTEAEAVAFLEEKGMTATTPDLDAFRNHVVEEYLGSDFSANWPDGMVERINAL
ncbi:MAG: TRAP transporter substrate-binding protein DctP, partial [Pseudomonadota bacterium]